MNGQVVGLELIKALSAAQAAEANFETANQSALDALIEKLGVVAVDNFALDLKAAYDEAVIVRGGGDSTAVLEVRASEAATALTTAFNGLSADDKVAANKYAAAIAAEATAKAGAATTIEQGSAIGGLQGDASVTFGAHTSATALYDEYVAATPQARALIDAEFKDSAFYATFKAVAAKDAAYADAIKATLAAKDALDSDSVVSTTTVQIHGQPVTAANTDAGGTGQAYVDATAAKAIADKNVADAKAADTDLAAVKAIVDGYKALTDKTEAADDAIFDLVTGFNATHTDAKIDTLKADKTGLDTVKETFFFADKAVAADDFSITKFGAGDSIVLGSGYTFNKGALSTGDNNKSEFFLIQKGSDTLVVLETDNFGSSTTTHTATGDAAMVAGDSLNAAVITLTGVNVADLTVNNGVISHVA